MWTTPLPAGSAKVDLDGGTASLKANNICSVFDAFTVANSFSKDRASGFASGIINSLDIEWSNVIPGQSLVGFKDPANRFMGDFYRIGTVTIAVTATTPLSTGHGFRFVSEPSTTTVNFAQIGSESNGVFFMP